MIVSCGALGRARTGSLASLAAWAAGGWPVLVRRRPARARAGCWSGGQHPGAAVPGQALADQIAQVQGGGAALEPGVVLGHPAVAELEPAAPAGGHLGDG